MSAKSLENSNRIRLRCNFEPLLAERNLFGWIIYFLGLLRVKMSRIILSEKTSEVLEYFLLFIRNSSRTSTASEETIDKSFKNAIQLEEILQQEENDEVIQDFSKNYQIATFKKPVEILMKHILLNHNLNEHLTLYAINKYILLSSKSDFSQLLEKTLSEIELRGQIFNLIEEFPDVDLDFFSINKFLCEMSNADVKSHVFNYLKSQTSRFLKAVKYTTAFNAQVIVKEMITCLESQTDLRLWFLIMKNENLNVVIDLCIEYKNFFQAVLKFFDKFANETETNYDEDLNVMYSHLNLDFEEFVTILKSFLNENSITETINDYLESKSVTDKNFCFWVDVKACL